LAAVYSREIDGKTLTLAPSGWTYGENSSTSLFVLYDKETESLWFPFKGSALTGIGGTHKDKKLAEITSVKITTWFSWKSSHQSSGYLVP